jgi:uncharacterized protein (DUF433 family)
MVFSRLKEEQALGTLVLEVCRMIPADAVIIKDKNILGGTPVFRGTRVPFQALLDYLEGGQSLEEFLDDFPTVTREAAIAALELAKSSLVSQLG